SPGVNTCIGLPGFDVHHDTRITTLYTGTAQAGYAWGSTLWYVKGGWAGGELRRDTRRINGGPSPFLQSATTLPPPAHPPPTGSTAGPGLEWLVIKNLSNGIEYDYFHLPAGAFSNIGTTFAATPAFFTNWSDVSVNVHQVVVRANVLVDWSVFWR